MAAMRSIMRGSPFLPTPASFFQCGRFGTGTRPRPKVMVRFMSPSLGYDAVRLSPGRCRMRPNGPWPMSLASRGATSNHPDFSRPCPPSGTEGGVHQLVTTSRDNPKRSAIGAVGQGHPPSVGPERRPADRIASMSMICRLPPHRKRYSRGFGQNRFSPPFRTECAEHPGSCREEARLPDSRSTM